MMGKYMLVKRGTGPTAGLRIKAAILLPQRAQRLYTKGTMGVCFHFQPIN